jgi:Large polyvalent protein associated domain 29
MGVRENDQPHAKGNKMSAATKTIVAKAVRVELKKSFPGVKFSVRSASSVYVQWTDGPAAQDVRDAVAKFELGNFDGMTDSYDYNNIRSDVPQTRFVLCMRDRSETVEA